MARVAFVIAFVSLGCHAAPIPEFVLEDATPETGASDGDASEAEVPTGCQYEGLPYDAHIPLEGGAICEGHDEECDGVPDECDDCPGIPNADQVIGGRKIGAACISTPPFSTSRRLLFASFQGPKLGAWDTFGASTESPFDVKPDFFGDPVLAGGTDHALRFILARESPESATTVVTTQFALAGGLSDTPGKPVIAGIVFRAATSVGEAKRFYGCYLGGVRQSRFGVGFTDGCKGGDECVLTMLAESPVPDAILRHRTYFGGNLPVGLRASITRDDGTGKGTLECRVWDVAERGTLLTSDPQYVERVDLGSDSTKPWFPSGQVGLFWQRQYGFFFHFDTLVSGP